MVDDACASGNEIDSLPIVVVAAAAGSFVIQLSLLVLYYCVSTFNVTFASNKHSYTLCPFTVHYITCQFYEIDVNFVSEFHTIGSINTNIV